MYSIGTITLNLSFVCYLFFYLPQLIHNFRYKRIAGLSFAMHAILFCAVTADIYYAFGRINQWQYRVVSVLMFLSLLTQHAQLFFYRKQFSFGFVKWLVLSVLIISMLVGVFVVELMILQPMATYIFMGWVSQVAYWTYVLPQILKNRSARHVGSISLLFATIGVLVSVLDLISAWSFTWGTPSLYGGFVAVILQCWLLCQCLQKWKIDCVSEKFLATS